jgi:hypothetical protein
MQLRDAVQRTQALVDAGTVRGLDAAALLALVELAKRIQAARRPLAVLNQALQEHLNQQDLFGGGGGDGG